MHYVVRIGGVIGGVAAGSALLAIALTWGLAHLGLTLGVSGFSVFVGLLVAGMVGAMMTKDSWLFL